MVRHNRYKSVVINNEGLQPKQLKSGEQYNNN